MKTHDIEDLNQFVHILLEDGNIESEQDYHQRMRNASRQLKIMPSKSNIHTAYRKLLDQGEIEANSGFEHYGVRKAVRSIYGVLVITTFTSAYPGMDGNGNPISFDCQYDCHYCPKEPGQPRSYLSTEPGVMRAIRNKYDPIRQFDDRLGGLISCGHIPDKIEILVLGGTWSSYPVEYREWFIRQTYYACNTYFNRKRAVECEKYIDQNIVEKYAFWEKDEFLDYGLVAYLLVWPIMWLLGFYCQKIRESMYHPVRECLDLKSERKINENNPRRIIGITLETRPDCINATEIKRFRSYGCTRIQIGIQHVDDEILHKINRRCQNRHNIRGIRMLKEAGFKVDIHIMPDLPGSSLEKDREMFDYILSNPDLQVDQWKIYPCSVTPFTKIQEWYEKGEYIPYAETNWEGFKELLIYVKMNIHPWIRLNRIIRDIPNESIIGGNSVTHLRDVLKREMRNRNLRCRCIRCREVKNLVKDIRNEDMHLRVREYSASGGHEFYISIESQDESILYAHLRLRINENPRKNIFPELQNASLIRELHVYGKLVGIGDKTSYTDRAQHRGLGSQLLKKAEEITIENGLRKIAVISGDGVKEYYRNKHQYQDEGDYLTKVLD